MTNIANVLAIAGSDPSGGAGIQADLKTISALGGYGMAAITCLTAQNTLGIIGLNPISADFVALQLNSLMADDIPLSGIKLGALCTEENVVCIANWLIHLQHIPIVLDPVCIASSGDTLAIEQKFLLKILIECLLPKVSIITPNIAEASQLLELSSLPESNADMQQIAKDLHSLGAKQVLLKGGHLTQQHATDVYYNGKVMQNFQAPFIVTKNTHGTGCTLSSALATFLAQGQPMLSAIAKAKCYVTRAIQQSHLLAVGHGHGPLHHFHAWW